jgi:DNA-damage-inducible protein J
MRRHRKGTIGHCNNQRGRGRWVCIHPIDVAPVAQMSYKNALFPVNYRVCRKTMTGFVRARIEDDLKNEATAVLDAIGLTVSDAIRMLLTRIAKEKALPIELIIPNARTIAAMEEGRAILKRNQKQLKTAEEMFGELEKAGRKERKSKASAPV